MAKSLAGADVALKQPVHAPRGRHVREDVGNRPLLRANQRERRRNAKRCNGIAAPSA
jgi:hypothetical protein